MFKIRFLICGSNDYSRQSERERERKREKEIRNGQTCPVYRDGWAV